MAASKAESQKIFEKLKLKPANKVPLFAPLTRRLRYLDGHTDFFLLSGLLRLWFQEPNMVVRSVWHLSVPGLLL